MIDEQSRRTSTYRATTGLTKITGNKAPPGPGVNHDGSSIPWKWLLTLVYRDDIGREELWKRYHYALFLLFGIPTLIIFGAYDLWKGQWATSLLIAVLTASLSMGLILLRVVSNSSLVFRMNSFLYSFLLFKLMVEGGDSGSKLLWMYTSPLLCFFLYGKREGLVLTAATFLISALVLFFPGMPFDVYPYPLAMKIRFLTTFLIVSGITFGFEYFRNHYFGMLEEEKQKLQKETRLLNEEITERKKAESEREALQAKLKRAEKMEALGTLAGGVAHDLNNVLSGVVGYPQLLLMELPEDSPYRDSVACIKRSGEKAAAIVQDLLTLARRGIPTVQPLDLNDVVQEYLNGPEHRRLTESIPGVTVRTDLAGDLLPLTGSRIHLFKTLMNLVANGFEAIAAEGRVDIVTANHYIDRPLKGYDDILEGDYVLLQVRDTGTGIARVEMDRIFEPFYTTKAMGKAGSGLGMAVVWGTVKDHGGYIQVESQLGKGSVVNIYFKAFRDRMSESQSSLPQEALKGSGESILVVDDILQQRDIASQMLTHLGYRPLTVASGEDAIECMSARSVDLVVLDMIMEPGMDGLDTYRRILERCPSQRAVIASGFSETHRVKEAIKLGVGAYIQKPYTIEKLAKAIREGLGYSET